MGTLAWVDLNCCSSFIFGMGHCIVATFLVKQVNNVNMDDVTLPSSVVTLPADVEGSSIPAMLDDEPSSKASRVAVDECLEVDLPMMVSDDDEVANAFDDCIEPFSDSEEDFMELVVDGINVPIPEVAKLLEGNHAAAEYYSPPRVLQVAALKGFRVCLSLDLLSGWDFRCKALRDLSVGLLTSLQIMVLFLSCPCTIFSDLQRLWNFKKMEKETLTRKWQEGMLYLEHAMACAAKQYYEGRFFVHEHPARASSWAQPCVKAIEALPNVFVVVLDLCMLGLSSKVHKTPTRKRTKIMTNSVAIASRLAGHMCDGRHEHQAIQGSEGGLRRSVWAQIYPPALVELFVAGIQDHHR